MPSYCVCVKNVYPPHYYDKAAVESEDIDEAELDDDHEYVEWSTVDEVKQWIKNSGRSVV